MDRVPLFKNLASLVSVVAVFALIFLSFSTKDAHAVAFTRKVFLQNETANSVDFRWVTDTTEALIVKYGTSTSYGSQVNSDTVSGTGGANNHAKITGLTANTTYYYQVTTAGGAALTPAGDTNYHFKTAPATGSTTPFSFAIWGDSGDNSSSQDAVSNQVLAKNPSLVIIAGDIAYGYTTSFANNNTQYFNHYPNVMRFAPFYVTCGNHESSCSTVMADHTLPGNGSQAGQSVYSFDYGNAHFVALNSEANHGLSDTQMTWAASDIRAAKARNPKPWVVVFWHQNYWSAGSHSTQSSFEPMVRMSADAGADVVAWGHSHVYERWTRTSSYNNMQVYTIGNGGKKNGAPGCTSVGPGCAGKSNGESGFLLGEVNGSSLTMRYITQTGTNPDSITLSLGGGGGPTNPPATNTPTRPPNSTNTPTTRPANTSTPQPTVPQGTGGDANGDGKVDGLDFVIWLNHYNQNVSGSANGDFNNSGNVDGVDFTIWLSNYGRGVPTPPGSTRTPTPTRPPNATNTPTIRVNTPTSGPVPTSPPGGSNPLTDCSGANGPKRMFLETQAWWMATSSIGTSEQLPVTGGIGGHAHTATCFPQDQQVNNSTVPVDPATGKHLLKFNVRLMIHKGNRANVEWLDIGLGPGGESVARVDNLNYTCAGAEDPKKQCEWWVPISLDISKIPSGYQELRFRFNVIQPNGERMFASTGWQAWYHNGTSTYRNPPWVEARGWYEKTAYLNARLLSAPPYNPVSGNYTFTAEFTPGSGGKAVADRAAHVDARFNFDDFGKIYAAGNGSWKGSVTIDTTQLTNGPHCVALRTSSIDVSDGTDTGVLQFPIIVNNPGHPSGAGKGGCYPGT